MTLPSRAPDPQPMAAHDRAAVNSESTQSASQAQEARAAVAAALFAVDPTGLGGVVLRSAAGPARERWLATLRELLPGDTPWRRVPLHINDDRLLGGLDLAATLQAGHAVAQRGLLAEADGGVLVLAMAERVTRSTAASIAAVLDHQELVVERHGVAARHPSRLGVVALDEGLDEEERPPPRLNERLAFHLELGVRRESLADRPDETAAWSRSEVAIARLRLPGVTMADPLVQGLCAAGIALGVDSMRAPLLACRAARAAAALAGRDAVNEDDAALAAALVLAPRATRVPAADTPADAPADTPADAVDEPADAAPPPESPDPSEMPPPPPPDSEDSDGVDEPDASAPVAAIDDMVLQAALASIPPGLLAALALGKAKAAQTSAGGKAGAVRKAMTRGRPIGTRQGELRGGARLNLLATLRCAAPWQALRQREDQRAGGSGDARVRVRREDFQLWRFQQRSETTTVFVVDASGSSALNRLGEAKGAVELLLADCYVRRDSVAVIAFRGQGAELLLSPTRSLARAKRGLAGLPGGGGTPLAAGIDAALLLALAVRRRGATPVVVLLTDGRANIARDGTPGRARANEDALAAARQLRAEGLAALLIDTSPQPQETASRLASDMGARYVALPHAGAATLSQVVRAAAAAPSDRS